MAPRTSTTLSLAAVLVLASACVDSSKSKPEARVGDRGEALTKATVVVPTIDWPGASEIDQAALAELPAPLRDVLRRSPVPVLVPKGMSASEATLLVDREWYAFSAKLPGEAHLHVQGTRAAKDRGVAPIDGHVDLRGGKGFLTENEGIRIASFRERGASYSVDLECARASDVRCSSGDAVRAIANALAFVGGEGTR